jgi:hypothetical protein
VVCFVEKTWCWLGVIPVLVFDCVALRFKMGISGRLSRVNPHGWGLFTLGAVFTALGFFWYLFFPKEKYFVKHLLIFF